MKDRYWNPIISISSYGQACPYAPKAWRITPASLFANDVTNEGYLLAGNTNAQVKGKTGVQLFKVGHVGIEPTTTGQCGH
jgi:hypothetical protein